MLTLAKVDQQLDVTGRHCPYPVIQCKAALVRLQRGETLLLKASDPDSVREIPLLVATRGDELVEMCTRDGIFYFRIRSTTDRPRLRTGRPLAELGALLRDTLLPFGSGAAEATA